MLLKFVMMVVERLTVWMVLLTVMLILVRMGSKDDVKVEWRTYIGESLSRLKIFNFSHVFPFPFHTGTAYMSINIFIFYQNHIPASRLLLISELFYYPKLSFN